MTFSKTAKVRVSEFQLNKFEGSLNVPASTVRLILKRFHLSVQSQHVQSTLVMIRISTSWRSRSEKLETRFQAWFPNNRRIFRLKKLPKRPCALSVLWIASLQQQGQNYHLLLRLKFCLGKTAMPLFQPNVARMRWFVELTIVKLLSIIEELAYKRISVVLICPVVSTYIIHLECVVMFHVKVMLITKLHIRNLIRLNK